MMLFDNDELAASLIAAGLCVLPKRRDKKAPAVDDWTKFQRRMPTPSEVMGFDFSHGICVVCGEVSGNVEMIDFDHEAAFYGSWKSIVEAQRPELLDRLYIEGTVRGGVHVIYRCEEPIQGSQKLASAEMNDGYVVLIETRGEGGLTVVAPTPGYAVISGSLEDLPVLAAQDRDFLIDAAKSLHEPKAQPAARAPAPAPRPVSDGGRPGEDYNARGDVRALLVKHGWRPLFTKGGAEHFARPGKDSGESANLKDRVLYVHSTNAPLEAGRGHSPFAVYAALEHRGDYAAAARELAKQGFGSPTRERPTTDRKAVGEPTLPDWFRIRNLSIELANGDPVLNGEIIHGLVRVREIMNIISTAKVGKSWLVAQLALSVANGREFLGFATTKTKVLVIDTELHECDFKMRLSTVAERLALPTDGVEYVCMRGADADMVDMDADRVFEIIKDRGFGLIIIDALFKVLPQGADENDNAGMAKLYNTLNRWSLTTSAAIGVVHHASKGNQSEKSVTDVGSGAGSMSRAVDTHLVLRAHEEDKCVVLEARCRTFPPIAAVGLRFNYPAWEVDETIDTTLLQGKARTRVDEREVKVAPGVQEFLDAVFGISNDPLCRADAKDHFARKGYDPKHFGGAWDRAYSSQQIRQVRKAVKDGAPALYSRVFVTQ